MIAAGLFDAMLDAGFNPPNNTDGEITRFSTNGKTHNKDGWLVVFDDSGACFGCWREGTRHTWSDKSKFNAMSNEEQNAFEFKRRMAMQQAEFEREQRYNFAASESLEEWQNAPVCESHDYLERKSVAACENLRVGLDGRLIVPVFESSEKIQSLQYIDIEGKKRFKTDGKMKGGFFVVGDIGSDCYLCEGLATALTIHAATGKGVVVAFSASNMPSVYEKFKAHNVTVCADNDAHGVGLKYANECKGAIVVYPPIVGMDFNDLGVDGTREILGVKNESLFMSVSELMAGDYKTNWLIKGYIERGAIGMIHGESGCGKSLFTLDWSYCVATGRNWHGFKVRKPAKAMYVAGEGSRGFKMRLTSLNQKYGSEIKDNLCFSRQSFNFLDKKTAEMIIDEVEKTGFIPELLFIDTLHRNMIGDENKAEDMGQFVATIEILVKKYNCTVAIVHHSGIADKNRARGSSATYAAMDFVFSVVKNNDFESSLICQKMKDADKPQPLKFLLHKIELQGDEWRDEDDGKRQTGVYFQYGGVDTEKEQKLSKAHQTALDALKQAISEVGKKNKGECLVYGLGEVEVIHKETYRKYFNDTCKGTNKARDYTDALKSLKNRQYIGEDGDYLWVIEE
jgi:KaiC/GvpD/RAD55 family RecA-like ATPase